MLNRFGGKVIAIAGGAGGIGTAVSQRLAAEGAAVMIGDVNIANAEQVAASIRSNGGRTTAFQLSLGDEASVLAFVNAAVETYGGLDGLHANASDSSRQAEDQDVVEMDMSVYDQMMGVNTRGFFLCTRHALPHLLRRGGGAILYTSSGAAYQALTTRPLYAMGKNAVHGLSRHVASKYGKQGVRSNVICPGLIVHQGVIDTMGQKFVDDTLQMVKTPRHGKPEDIAAMAALLLSDEGAFVTGQVICVDGGSTMRA